MYKELKKQKKITACRTWLNNIFVLTLVLHNQKKAYSKKVTSTLQVGPGKHGKRLWTRMWMICSYNSVMLLIAVNGGER